MPLAAGTHLGPYRVVSPLGSGGMGEVYRAHDDRLGRDVAIKVLPHGLVVTPEARARFEREARTLSQLNHPHICTLHDRGHQDGIDFLVMELIEGQTLAQRLSRGPLPVPETLALGRQIAAALDRAHRAGVVHRDLKPGNVMLTKGGAKLMDFGLARPAAPVASGAMSHSPTMSQPLTAEGSIVGTFQYMAPEQLEGKEADARTDLWALGCVLYEMATGAPAFEAESQASLIAAIMTGAPRPIVERSPVTPPALERLIQRCLQKDPDSRVQSALDVAFVLEMIAAGDVRGDASVRAGTTGVRRAMRALWVGGAALVAAIAFVAGRLTAPPSGEASIRVSTLSQGTRDSEPSVSRDGRLIAFTAVRQSGPGIWLMDMVSRNEVKLTSGDDHFPRFTADGGTVLFTRTHNGRQSLWRIPAIGGAPRLLLEDAGDVDASPDGSRIAYIASTGDSAGVQARLMVAKADGTGGRELWSKGSVSIGSPRWSPDSRYIVLFKAGSQNLPSTLVMVDVSNGTAREFPGPTGQLLSTPVWDGGRGLIVAEGVGITAIQRGASGRLFRLDSRTGKYRPLGWLENFPTVIDLMPDGRLVLWSPGARQNLREVQIGARELSGGRQLTSGLAIDRQPVYSPDGMAVMFSSNRGGTLDLWEVSVTTGEMHRVTDDREDDWDPEYGSDGQSLFWCSSRSGPFEIWAARRDGSAPRQVSRDSLDAENPSVSPDGQSVIYSSAHPRKAGLWLVPAAGGEGERLLRASSLIPDLSPDGRYLSVITDVGTIEARLSVFDLQGRRLLPGSVPLQVFPGTVQVGRARFMPDGAAIAYIQLRENGQPILVKRPLSAWHTGSGAIDTLFAATTEGIESFGFSPDGKRATVSIVDWLSPLTIAEGIRGIVPPKRSK